jgi:hypothetical protein
MYKQLKPIMGATTETAVLRLTDGWSIPFDPDNTDYQDYLKWLEEGNAPIGADTPIPSDSVADDNN